MPILRHTSATVTPVSAWRRANTIWASVNLVFFMTLSIGLRYDKCPIFSTLQRPSLMGGGQTIITHLAQFQQAAEKISKHSALQGPDASQDRSDAKRFRTMAEQG